MYVLQFKLFSPPPEHQFLFQSISRFNFHLMTLMTLLATASGYIINDWFDYKIDLVNKPNKVIINKKITWRAARRSYLFFVIAGAFISSYLSSKTGLWGITIIYNTVSILLFLYAQFLKRSFFFGNFVVALLCCFVPLLVGYVNFELLQQLHYGDFLTLPKRQHVFFAFVIFSFLITFFREIVKDIEDVEGDKKYLARTIPIALGIRGAKSIAGIMGLFILLGLLFSSVFFSFVTSFNISFFVGVALFLFIAWSIFLLKKAASRTDFGQLSFVLKGCMLLGLLWLIVL